MQLEFTDLPKNRIRSPESLLKGHLDICKGRYLELWMSLLAFSKSVISQVWGVAVGADTASVPGTAAEAVEDGWEPDEEVEKKKEEQV